MASLNPDQIKAVHAYEPAVLVLSGAGTGKQGLSWSILSG